MNKEIEYLQPIGRDQATGFVIFHPHVILDLDADNMIEDSNMVDVGTDYELQWNWRETRRWGIPRDWSTIQRYNDALVKGREELRRSICNETK